MDYQIINNIKDDDTLRDSFNSLAVKTFDLSFKKWYEQGYWTDKYIPYVLTSPTKNKLDKNVVANVSVNIIDTLWQNTPKRYLQLGTVMTEKSYRNKGLSRILMEKILSDWQDKCDAIFLFANPTVLDFYPKFGFKKEIEHQCHMSITTTGGRARKLNMSTVKDVAFLKEYYDKQNPFSALPMVNNFGLLMFYCSDFMKNDVYYCPEYDAVVIATQEEDTLLCFDIYCSKEKPLLPILSAVAALKTTKVIFNFPLKDTRGCSLTEIESEDTLFILNSKENIFKKNKLMFPFLSHA